MPKQGGDHFDDDFEQLSPVSRSKAAPADSGYTSSSGPGRSAGPAQRDDTKVSSSEGSGSPRARGRPGLSLKARAVGYLSRREHSRAELARKLQPYVDPDKPQELQQVLDELARDNWQSDQRFARSLVHRRASKKGAALVLQELRQHGLQGAEIDDIRHELEATEIERAREVWQKKFGEAPADRREYARQYRFLASRGFSARCLSAILGELDD